MGNFHHRYHSGLCPDSGAVTEPCSHNLVPASKDLVVICIVGFLINALTPFPDMASNVTPTLYGLGSILERLYGVAVSLLIITWLAVLARAYVRCYMLRSLG